MEHYRAVVLENTDYPSGCGGIDYGKLCMVAYGPKKRPTKSTREV